MNDDYFKPCSTTLQETEQQSTTECFNTKQVRGRCQNVFSLTRARFRGSVVNGDKPYSHSAQLDNDD